MAVGSATHRLLLITAISQASDPQSNDPQHPLTFILQPGLKPQPLICHRLMNFQQNALPVVLITRFETPTAFLSWELSFVCLLLLPDVSMYGDQSYLTLW